MLKIISGRYKNRIIPSNKALKCKPSTGQFKEAVFSILSSRDFINNPIIDHAKVLDLFCGTGSYAFEALSRGAASATLVDIDSEPLRKAKDFANVINESKNVTCLHLNSTTLPKSSYQYNLIFIDPPYNKNLITNSIRSLLQGNWLGTNAVLVLEMSKNEDYAPLENFTIVTKRTYGGSKLVIMRYQQLYKI